MGTHTQPFQNLSDSRNNSTKFRKTSQLNLSTQTRILTFFTFIKDSSTRYENKNIINEADDKKMLENLKILDGFKTLQKGWNDNNAEPFDLQLIQKVKSIISIISPQPDVFPTACNSIQLEYEMENGNYLEFEIFTDNIKAFQIIDGKESTVNIIKDDISKHIEKFYASK